MITHPPLTKLTVHSVNYRRNACSFIQREFIDDLSLETYSDLFALLELKYYEHTLTTSEVRTSKHLM